MLSRRALPVVALFAAASVIGCGDGEGVKSYHAPRTATPTGKENTGPYRLLGAMVPADDPVWFFKLSGVTDDLTKVEAGFDELVKSIRDKGKAAPEFAAPAGWKVGPGRGDLVRATIIPPDSKLEVTVVSAAGGVEGNLKRWVEMLGNPYRPGMDEARFTKVVDAAGGAVRRVDIRGSKNPNAGMMGKR